MWVTPGSIIPYKKIFSNLFVSSSLMASLIINRALTKLIVRCHIIIKTFGIFRLYPKV